jgi:hypothetical protein
LHVHLVQYLGASFYFEHISEFQSIDFHSLTAAYFETLLVLAIAAAADAATFFAQNELGPRIRLYSSWQWGGYLIYRLWPTVHVFDDGRTDFYGPAFVEEGLRVWDACPDWAKILANHQVNSALLPIDSALGTVLRERPDWKLVYQDRVALLFVKIERK